MMRAAALAAAALLGSGAARAADAGALDALLARLDAQSRAVQGLSGEFTQKNRIKLFKQVVTSRGRFHFQRPRRIRWEYLDPDPSTLVLDGDTATLKTPGAPPQVFDLARDAVMRAVFDQLLLWLGSDTLARAKGDYQLAAGGTVDEPTLALTPRPGGSIARAFARIELRFDKRLLLRGILLSEAGGDEKEITFTKMEKNPTLPRDAFKP
jgi:outer membrane lipoprotein-sorting protein